MKKSKQTKEQQKQYFKEYYKRNQDKLKQYQSNYYNNKAGKSNIPVEFKKGIFILNFD